MSFIDSVEEEEMEVEEEEMEMEEEEMEEDDKGNMKVEIGNKAMEIEMEKNKEKKKEEEEEEEGRLELWRDLCWCLLLICELVVIILMIILETYYYVGFVTASCAALIANRPIGAVGAILVNGFIYGMITGMYSWLNNFEWYYIEKESTVKASQYVNLVAVILAVLGLILTFAIWIRNKRHPPEKKRPEPEPEPLTAQPEP